MGLFGFGKAAVPQTTDFKEIVAFYQRLRPIRLRLNNELVRRLPPGALEEGAKKIGLLRGGVFVFDNEDETSVLMDYCIYDVYRKGRNAIEQYLHDNPPHPDSDEMACLGAMQHATYALVAVLGVEPGVGCHIRNLFTEETQLLVDMGLSKSAMSGAVIATRLLDFGSFVASGGASLPVGLLNADELDRWQQKICSGVHEEHFDPAPLIRECLQKGASSHVRYEGIDTQRRLDAGESSPPARISAQERRALAKQHASKPVENRRCRCGSGKMYKNCCGKHSKSD